MRAFIPRTPSRQRTSFSPSLLFCCSTARPEAITQAIFNGQFSSIKLPQESPLYKKFSFIMEMEGRGEGDGLEQLGKADPHTLAASLEYIARMSRRYGRNVVELQPYLKLVERYYEGFGLHSEREIINKVLKPEVEVSSLLPSFIHLDSRKLRDTVKTKQFSLLEFISKSRRLGMGDFMRIVSPQVYNNTDLPLILSQFYRHLYPHILQIDNFRQLHSLIHYLSRFESIPILLIDHSFSLLSREVEMASSLEDCLTIASCINLIFFRANNCCEQLGKPFELLRLHQKLSNRMFRIGGREVCLRELQDESVLRKAIEGLALQVCQAIKSHIEELRRQEDSHLLPRLVGRLQGQQIQLLASLDHRGVEQLVETELLPTLAQFFLAQIYMMAYSSALAHKFINSQAFSLFYQKHPAYPDLTRNLLLTAIMFQTVWNKKLITSPELLTAVTDFRQKINEFLNKTLKEGSSEAILQSYSPSNVFRNHEGAHLWSLRGEALVCRVLEASQADHTAANLLGMLQEDTQFLRSRMRFNELDALRYVLATAQECLIDTWDYPVHYTAKFTPTVGKGQAKIAYDRFTKDLFFPANVNPQIAAKCFIKVISKVLGSCKK